MANEKIEIDIVLNDGSIAKGFTKLNQEAKKTESSFSSIAKIAGGIQLSAAITSGLQSLSGLFSNAIKEAIQGEDSINALASSLKSAGTFSNDAVKSFQSFSEKIQDTTKFSDDAVLAGAALARNFSRTNEEALKLTEAAIQLSAATGNDLNTSIEQLGGTFTGTAGRLAKTVPGLQGLTEAALKSGAALDIVLKRFDGTAQNQVLTFSGQIALATNRFNNFLEELGGFVTRSPALLKVFDTFSGVFNSISSGVTSELGDKDFLKNIILQFITFGQVITDFVIRPVEFLFNIFKVGIGITEVAFQGLLAGIGKVGGGIAKIIGLFSKDNAIAQGLSDFSASSGQVFSNSLTDLGKTALNVFDQTGSNAIDNFLTKVQLGVEATNGVLNDAVAKSRTTNNKASAILDPAQLKLVEELRVKVQKEFDLLQTSVDNLNVEGLKSEFETLPGVFDILAASSTQSLNEISAQFANFDNGAKARAQSIADTFTKLSADFKTGFANAIGNAIESLVTALVNGEDGFKAFAGALLATLADLGIQTGKQLIALGIGLTALSFAFTNPLTSGPALIAAGAGILAVASLLKALVGKGSGGSSVATGSSITPPGTPATPVSGADGAINNNQRPGVNVVIQGNIFDSDSTGLRIATILKEQGFANAVRA
jgi:hypothetical protein